MTAEAIGNSLTLRIKYAQNVYAIKLYGRAMMAYAAAQAAVMATYFALSTKEEIEAELGEVEDQISETESKISKIQRGNSTRGDGPYSTDGSEQYLIELTQRQAALAKALAQAQNAGAEPPPAGGSIE